MPTSQLFWNEGKKTFEVEITNRRGETKKMTCDVAELSAGLPSGLPDEPVEVEFERDLHGKPLKVRPVGKEWIDPKQRSNKPDYSKRESEPSSDKSKFGRDEGSDLGQAKKEAQTMKREFHNPYNFVPALPRNEKQDFANLEEAKRILVEQLCDSEPCGHDRYIADKYSGKLSVTMRVETPLLLPDTARMHYNNEHKSYPVRTRLEQLVKDDKPVFDKEGKPVLVEIPDINPTAIKGMLRSAYEAITNSRLSVFKDHDERLAFRMESTEGARIVPARIESVEGKEEIVLYTGTSSLKDKDNKDGEPQDGNPLCAAWIPTYHKGSCRLSNSAVKLSLEDRVPTHKEEVWAWLEEFERYARREKDLRGRTASEKWRYVLNFKYWRVRFMSKDETQLDKNKPSLSTRTTHQAVLNNTPNSKDPDKTLHIPTGKQLVKVRGFVCVTGKNTVNPNEQNGYTSSNIENKHDERLFFNLHNNLFEPLYARVELTAALQKKWNDLIKNYRLGHIADINKPPRARRGNQEIPLHWSRHIRETLESEISPDSKLKSEKIGNETLCYARVRWNNGNNRFDVLELYPVGISRRLHTTPPSELLPDELKLKPAKAMNELSPADRVFGWVGHSVKRNGAYRGQIRIGTVSCDDTDAIKYFNKDNPRDWLPLQILGQPKPQQGRFYVAQDQDGDAQPNGLNNEDAGYMKETNYRQGGKEKKGLRGRKVYPHHNNLPDDYWKDATNPNLETSKKDRGFYKEYRRRRNEGIEQRDSQNRSIQGWVKPTIGFKFNIHFINLSELELGILIWLLNLNANQFHRFGGGKPLGFGSVHLRLEDTDVRSGEHWKEFYRSLEDKATGKLDKAAIEKLASDFRTEINSSYPNVLKSFIRVCEGFADYLPTHYPRARHYPPQTDDSLPPHEEGLAYEWFVENNKKTLHNNPNTETQIALSNITEDEGLPIFWHKK